MIQSTYPRSVSDQATLGRGSLHLVDAYPLNDAHYLSYTLPKLLPVLALVRRQIAGSQHSDARLDGPQPFLAHSRDAFRSARPVRIAHGFLSTGGGEGSQRQLVLVMGG